MLAKNLFGFIWSFADNYKYQYTVYTIHWSSKSFDQPERERESEHLHPEMLLNLVKPNFLSVHKALINQNASNFLNQNIHLTFSNSF